MLLRPRTANMNKLVKARVFFIALHPRGRGCVMPFFGWAAQTVSDGMVDEHYAIVTAGITVIVFLCALFGNIAQRLNNDFW